MLVLPLCFFLSSCWQSVLFFFPSFSLCVFDKCTIVYALPRLTCCIVECIMRLYKNGGLPSEAEIFPPCVCAVIQNKMLSPALFLLGGSLHFTGQHLDTVTSCVLVVVLGGNVRTRIRRMGMNAQNRKKNEWDERTRHTFYIVNAFFTIKGEDCPHRQTARITHTHKNRGKRV